MIAVVVFIAVLVVAGLRAWLGSYTPPLDLCDNSPQWPFTPYRKC